MSTRPTVSVIIPYMESDPGKPAILRRCVESFEGAGEVIVVWNDRMGYAKPINKGLALARGDYLVVMNDDLDWCGHDLRRLCDPLAVTSPLVNGKFQAFWGCAFCIPRHVYERTGGLDERYTISYYDDDDYSFTLDKLGIEKRGININVLHPEPGRTLNIVTKGTGAMEINRQKFLDKWGRLP
jgi:GT2 family glycosyltransferase